MSKINTINKTQLSLWLGELGLVRGDAPRESDKNCLRLGDYCQAGDNIENYFNTK